ncbi:VOC family protein [Massilia sp. TS11]|uniref:VOC family protein n=1 Tax=Massilia sp. TS11 TaxID=2908003 RepID=UPI001EDC2599|nr:VOC family protein [Massilia sp. TS11]MCG2586375.1 VOC family protein [Massilia sp. TS11]
MFEGLRTVLYPTPDLAQGKAWYASVFGVAPYFDEAFYVGFAVGGFELGLVPDATPGADGSVAYWGTPDCAAELARVLALGARLHKDVAEVGGGIKVAEVLDPFGNVLGLIENPHFDRAAVR